MEVRRAKKSYSGGFNSNRWSLLLVGLCGPVRWRPRSSACLAARQVPLGLLVYADVNSYVDCVWRVFADAAAARATVRSEAIA